MSKKKKRKVLKAAKTKADKLTGESILTWGKHKGTKLDNLPNHYCRWLLMQDWIGEHPALNMYLIDNESLFSSEGFDNSFERNIGY